VIFGELETNSLFLLHDAEEQNVQLEDATGFMEVIH